MPQITAYDRQRHGRRERSSTLPLVIFGGQGADQLTGGTRRQSVIVGDRGPRPLLRPGDGAPRDGTIDTAGLAALEALATTVYGHGGPGDRTDGVARLVGLVVGIDPTIGGGDTIKDGTGADVIVGGNGNDTITANIGETAVVTDGSDVVLGDTGFVDFAIADHDPTTVDRVWTTDPGTGGTDQITTGNSSDVVIGGDAGDTIQAGNGDNIVLGDDGRVTLLGGVRQSAISTDTSIGGNDSITTGSGNDVVLGGFGNDTADASSGNNVVLGDSGEFDFDPRCRRCAEEPRSRRRPTFGGNDAITTGIGNDVGDRRDRQRLRSSRTTVSCPGHRTASTWSSATTARSSTTAPTTTWARSTSSRRSTRRPAAASTRSRPAPRATS